MALRSGDFQSVRANSPASEPGKLLTRMVTIHNGARISKVARLRLCCSAAILDEQDRILLIQRDDDHRWISPGGAIEAGESVSEACVREIFEETGLQSRVKRLLGIYSNVDHIFEYPDGNRWQHIDLFFLCEIVGGDLRTTAEALDARFFGRDELATLDMHEVDRVRILRDVFPPPEGVILR